MPTPSPEQRAVIESAARLRVIQAAPGSGKTWMVGEVIRSELRGWTNPLAGVAALSFTRVGGDEIRAALGYSLGHPHFVGTLDAFLFRYVVRPHLRRIDPSAKVPQLIPPEWEPGTLWRSAILGGASAINPLECVWIGRDEEGKPRLARRQRFGGMERLEKDDQAAVLAFKKRMRARDGRITISDSALFAAAILSSPKHGASVRSEIVRRFPLLIVDELQDTGAFLSEALLQLLGDEGIRALLVGDPDQAIYEFNGASPTMFGRFSGLPGAEVRTLSASIRCPKHVTQSASFLKRTSGPLLAAGNAHGKALLVSYSSWPEHVEGVILAAFAENDGRSTKAIVRANTAAWDLTGRRAKAEVPALHCRCVELLQRSVQYFRRQRFVSALAAARAAVENALWGCEGLTDEEIAERGVRANVLKAAAVRALMDANQLPTECTALEWQLAALPILRGLLSELVQSEGIDWQRNLRSPSRHSGWNKPAGDSIPVLGSEAAAGRIDVQTVHSVKGETHDVTLFIVPPTPARSVASKCPSVAWWSESEAEDEERRIAYVALTRTRGDLLLCMHEDTVERVRERRPEFVASFQNMAASAYVESVAAAVSTTTG